MSRLNNATLNNATYFLKTKLLYLILKIWLQLLNLIINRTWKSFDLNYGTYLLNSGIIPSSKGNFYAWDKAWKDSMLEWNLGNYKKSVNLRKEVMFEVYKANNQDLIDYYPPFLSRIFAGPIGHNGVIGMLIGAQKYNIIPKGQRLLPVSKMIGIRPFFLSVKGDIKLVRIENQSSGDEFPSYWHIYERHQLIKTHDGFIDLYPLFEKVFYNIKNLSSSPILKLDIEYEQKAINLLSRAGLKKSDWFVTLHVRDTGIFGETREQPIESYLKSILYITNLGGKVIRIGDQSMKKLPPIKGLIDLSLDFKSNSFLHLYALAKARFFIGTNSGPKFMPPLFGVPSLITNLTSIGLESLFFTEMTRYIPKKIIHKKNATSLFDTLNSHIGYNNFTAKELKKQNIELLCNTELEIFEGVKEMMKLVSGETELYDAKLENHVNKIRESAFFSSSGLFSRYWLQQNAEWFLKTT